MAKRKTLIKNITSFEGRYIIYILRNVFLCIHFNHRLVLLKTKSFKKIQFYIDPFLCKDTQHVDLCLQIFPFFLLCLPKFLTWSYLSNLHDIFSHSLHATFLKYIQILVKHDFGREYIKLTPTLFWRFRCLTFTISDRCRLLIFFDQ